MNKSQKKEKRAIADEPARTRAVTRLASLLRKLRNRYLLTGLESRLRRHYDDGRSAAPPGSPVVTIECTENLFYVCLFG